jgi:outer membrane scaffolding protein for murein synthesis (MipA/OmpV family)
MAEEQEQSTGSSIKNMIIGLVSTITLGVGTWVTTQLTGGDKEETPVQQAAPVINITNSNQQAQQQSAGGKTIIIKEKAVGGNAQPAQPQPKPKKKEGDEFKEEAPKW